ncbi:MAG TPA: 1,4-alpha-glucan branching protein GlgB [Acidimicrobiales bacterium]|nr:1,4-alpha-glucan branching protein GlgB [Acidimicrobiales bacterium]
MTGTTNRKATEQGFERLASGEHSSPHDVLGRHGDEVRVWRPGAAEVTVVASDGRRATAEQAHPAGGFVARLSDADAYRLEVRYPDGATVLIDDPYRLWPTLGELDLHLIGEGSHRRLWEVLGAHCRVHDGVSGTAFAVWAPNARSVRVVGDFNLWDGRVHPMRTMGQSGLWELFLPDVGPGCRYKFEILTQQGHLLLKADPMARATELPPGTASIVAAPDHHQWRDGDWMNQRERADHRRQPMSVYEMHLGSWRHRPEEGNRPLSYDELADELPDYLVSMGFTHVEFMPVAEHPFGGSWGYQISSYFAPTSRFGSPEAFRRLVDRLHQRGIGVIVDWVPAHFPRDEWALANFDGTALYEHADPRKGAHPDWGTLVFNFGRNEVRNFLISNALYWIESFHIDGLRVDAVASMLYLDYSRKEGEWIPNEYGGRENIEAIDFLREANDAIHAEHPGVVTVAEESTAWPGVSQPSASGGLGFDYKWNMGWMHDTLDYFEKDPIYRVYHHDRLTFGLLYAFSEHFVLPLSHDEVVHGKRSLVDKMPGDKWQRFANLRALYGWMWAHPGKQLLFMGGEIGQWSEWSHDRSLDWHLLDDPLNKGVTELVRTLNRVYVETPALFTEDFSGEGFRWIDASDAASNVLSFLRLGDGPPLACVANLSPVVRHNYRIGLPSGGRWREVLNTDASEFGGSGVGNQGAVEAVQPGWHGLEYAAEMTLPPLGVLWLTPES